MTHDLSHRLVQAANARYPGTDTQSLSRLVVQMLGTIQTGLLCIRFLVRYLHLPERDQHREDEWVYTRLIRSYELQSIRMWNVLDGQPDVPQETVRYVLHLVKDACRIATYALYTHLLDTKAIRTEKDAPEPVLLTHEAQTWFKEVKAEFKEDRKAILDRFRWFAVLAWHVRTVELYLDLHPVHAGVSPTDDHAQPVRRVAN